MNQEKKSLIDKLKESILDKKLYSKLIRLVTYVALFFVALLMTVLNFINFGLNDLLTITTLAFSILIIPNFIVTNFSEKGSKVVGVLFSIELLAMFSIFLITGKPDGFSAIWIALIPIASMIFFGRNKGSILSGIMFLILIYFLWLPEKMHFGLEIYDYSQTFKVRFPILYIAFFVVAFLLETIQILQFNALENVNQINQQYSTHDGLTHIFNRKGFYDLLDKQLKEKTYTKIGFIIFDLDFFKELNDKYGHLAGDQVLIDFAQLIKENLPEGIYCRWGGEEFLVGYYDNDINYSKLEKFRIAIENHVFEYEKYQMHITVSCGVFETSDKNIENSQAWFKKADEALYKAKETGRNKVVYY